MNSTLIKEISDLISTLKDQRLNGDEPRRLVHGRGGTFPNFEFLNIDIFSSLIIVMLHEKREEAWQSSLANEILEFDGIQGVVVQDRSQKPSFQNCFGDVPDKIKIEAEGIKYELMPRSIKNPGWFLDMREGRAWVRSNSNGARVLNLFSYTCGFSLMSLAGGAQKVINMDMNSSVIKRGKENHVINDFSLRNVTFYHHDVLKSFGKIKRQGPYEIVIVDPPSIQTGSFQLRRDYPKIMRRLAEWMTEEGKALLCCNDPKVSDTEFEKWIAESFPREYYLMRLDQAKDYPERSRERSLKVYVLTSKLD